MNNEAGQPRAVIVKAIEHIAAALSLLDGIGESRASPLLDHALHLLDEEADQES